MRTNIDIDDGLLKKVMKNAGIKTKRAGVDHALQVVFRLQQQEGIRKLRGIGAWEGDLEQSRLSKHTDRS